MANGSFEKINFLLERPGYLVAGYGSLAATLAGVALVGTMGCVDGGWNLALGGCIALAILGVLFRIQFANPGLIRDIARVVVFQVWMLLLLFPLTSLLAARAWERRNEWDRSK